MTLSSGGRKAWGPWFGDYGGVWLRVQFVTYKNMHTLVPVVSIFITSIKVVSCYIVPALVTHKGASRSSAKGPLVK